MREVQYCRKRKCNTDKLHVIIFRYEFYIPNCLCARCVMMCSSTPGTSIGLIFLELHNGKGTGATVVFPAFAFLVAFLPRSFFTLSCRQGLT